jgi:hypothetical protein
VREGELHQLDVEPQVLRGHRVRTEQARALSGRDGDEDDHEQRRVERNERPTRPPQTGGRPTARRQQGFCENGDGQHREQHDELRPREHGDPDRGERDRIPHPGLPLDRVHERKQRPAGAGIGDDLREQERRERDPRHGDREAAADHSQNRAHADPAREQVDGDRRGCDHERVQAVRALEARRHVAASVHRREQDGIELVHVRDHLAVDARQQRTGLRDRDGEPLVVELVRHHEPVLHPRRRERQDPAECQRERRDGAESHE